MNLFNLYAPAYWARGLSVIPLVRMEKRPIPKNWSIFSDRLPDAATQEQWLRQYPDGNMGLVLGQQSNMIAVDVDTTDPKTQKILEEVLPPTPWKRTGAKGAVYGYRFNGIQTFRIKDERRNALVEVLSTGTQVVLPPSIHPKTKAPYFATADLLEVHDNLPVLPQEIEAILRGSLIEGGISLSSSGWTKVSEFIPSGARDNVMVQQAGILARAVTRGERTLLEAFGEMEQWVETYTEKVAGDEMDSLKGKQRIVQFLIRDVLGERRRALPKGWDAGMTPELKLQMGVNFDGEYEAWDYDRLKTYLISEFSTHGAETTGRSIAVEYVLDRMARTQITSLEEARLLKWIQDSGQLSMTQHALRVRLGELRKGEIQGQTHTELARVTLRNLEQYGEIRFDAGQFWQWKGADWQELREVEILQHIADEFGEEYQAARKFHDHRGILQVMASLAAKKLKDLTETYGINFANGFLTTDLEVLPHREAFGCTYTLPYCWKPELEDRAFRFHEFLRRAWGEDDDYEQKVLALQEAICATMFGLGPRYGRAVTLLGVPRSGKTEVLKMVIGLMPDGCYCTVPPADWGDKFLPTELHGRLLNICGELAEDRMIAGERFKSIVEGGEIAGQHKGKPIFKFKPVCAHWFASNHPPRTRDSSEGFNRRWLVLEFKKPVAASERVLDIGNRIIAEEREAIIAWAIPAIKRLEAQADYTLPPSHKRRMHDIANQNNSIRYFLTTSGKVRLGGNAASSRISEAKLFSEYSIFSSSGVDVRPVGSRAFRAKMRDIAGEFGIQIIESTSALGHLNVEYGNVTIVDAAE